MLSNLKIYSYNNYFNRKVLKEANLTSYGTPVYTLDNANFNPADGVNTSVILGTIDYLDNGNYLIVCDLENNIISRWFIIDTDRTRQGQFRVTLKRDVMVDFYDVITNSPCIINRAMLDENNPLIYNSEGFDFNQIKTNEILLQDDFRSRWIYLYMAKNAADKNDITVAYNPYAHEFDHSVNTISNSAFDGSEHNSYSLRDSTAVEIYAKYWCEYDGFEDYQYKKTFNDYSALLSTSGSYNLKIKFPGWNYYPSTITSNMKNAVKMNDTLMSALVTDYHNYLGSGNYMTSTDENFLQNAVGKTIYEQSTGKYYMVTSVTKTNHSHEIKNSLAYSFCTVLTNQLSSYFYDGTTPNNNTYNAELEYTSYKVKLTDLGNINFTVSVTPSSKATTDDNECNIIAIPLDGFMVQTGSEDPDTGYYPSVDISGNEEINIAIARSIAREYGTSVVYDMQILPYGPFPNSWTASRGVLDVNSMDSKLYQAVSYQPSTGRMYAGYIFYLPQSNLTFDINQSISINNFTDDSALNKKISNECDMYRLCSPNYNGIFEFSVAKNNGVSKFNVDMTLKPYNPYIHINPDFKGLYGQDFNDSRGLILGGDFSLPITADAFVNYELQNKNYQLAFDRQIHHMDVENKIARNETKWSLAAGSLTGAGAGAGIGTMAAGGLGVGTAVGAGIAGALSIGGGILDYQNLKKRQAENKDLAIDMFNYNLGNIKALPYSLNKVNPLTYNNKKYPFVELYEATAEEKNILLNKITYQSMTVNAIGTVADYIKASPTFISANLIRLSDGLDNHVSEEIYNELMKGVYI